MTMPNERTRALLMAGDLLRELLNSEDLPEEIRRQIVVVLRHYPESDDIAHQVRHITAITRWLG